MKSTIQHITYNTATAELVAEWDNGYFCTDFHYSSEDLYRTVKGAWFVHGSGGAMSKYSCWHGKSVGGGQKIIPLSEEQALKWCEAHDDENAIEEHFSHLVRMA